MNEQGMTDQELLELWERIQKQPDSNHKEIQEAMFLRNWSSRLGWYKTYNIENLETITK